MAEYLILIYGDEATQAAGGEEGVAVSMKAHAQFLADNAAAVRGGNALEPTATATAVRSRTDGVVVTDGPFVETKEALGGYYLVEAADLDEAIAIAKQVPADPSGIGGVEVRPIMPIDFSPS
jgi:hypothetical protein